jgi:predicted enzyme related to lactoylglutathione lyase
MSKIPLGRFCWYELLTTDPKAAPGFYEKITGWGTTPFQAEGSTPYTMWTNGEQPIGGIMQLPDEAAEAGAPPHWMVHISTPDLAATTAMAQTLGGAVLNQVTVPTVGEFAIVRDPQGAMFSAYQPGGDAPGHDGPPRVGEFSWNELATDGWEAAWGLYAQLFGWQKVDTVDMGEIGMYHMFGRGAHPLGGMFNRPPQMPASAWMFYARVPDVNAAVDAVKKHGGQVLNGPMDVPGGDQIAQCLDPQGAMFAVHQSAQG